MSKFLKITASVLVCVMLFTVCVSAAITKYDSAAQWANKQGNNQWYYMYGTSPKDYKEVTGVDNEAKMWFQSGVNGLQIKPDACHPGGDNDKNLKQAVYAWKAPADGTVSFSGTVSKPGHMDGNPKWPDGVAIHVYHKTQLLSTTNVAVKQGGDKVKTSAIIKKKTIKVKKGDFIYFAIDGKANNAWDYVFVNFKVELTSK